MMLLGRQEMKRTSEDANSVIVAELTETGFRRSNTVQPCSLAVSPHACALAPDTEVLATLPDDDPVIDSHTLPRVNAQQREGRNFYSKHLAMDEVDAGSDRATPQEEREKRRRRKVYSLFKAKKAMNEVDAGREEGETRRPFTIRGTSHPYPPILLSVIRR
jgi:hypothetical protein